MPAQIFSEQDSPSEMSLTRR